MKTKTASLAKPGVLRMALRRFFGSAVNDCLGQLSISINRGRQPAAIIS